MKSGVLISIIILGITPIVITILTATSRNDETNIVRFPSRTKCTILFLTCFLAGGLLLGFTLDESVEIWVGIAFFIPFFIVLIFVNLWFFVYRLTIYDDYFTHRNIFGKIKIYYYLDITGIKYLRGNRQVPTKTFKIIIGKKKIEISEMMVNFDLMYNKLSKERIFKKFPKTTSKPKR